MNERRENIWCLGILVALWAWFHAPVLFQSQVFMLQDSSRFFYPLWKWGEQAWNQGFIPLWNPDAGFGTPYLADPQMAVWYWPLRVLYDLLDPTTAFDAAILLHHLGALVGFWVLARSRGAAPRIALAGSLVFGFSFNALSLSWAAPMLFAYAWIPWVFWCMGRVRKGQKGAWVSLSMALAFQMSAGYPLFSYLTLLVLGLEGLMTWGSSGRSGNRVREWGSLVGAFVLALAYNAVWMLPFYEFVPHSNWEARLGMRAALSWSDLATWFDPFFKGHPFHSHPEMPYSVTVYFAGLPTLVLGLWAAWKSRLRNAALGLTALLVVLSLGETAGLGGWLKGILPAYGMVVRSGYWIPFVVWALALVLMEGGRELEGTDRPLGRQRSLLTAGEALWLLFAVFVYAMALALGVPWDLWSFWLSFVLLALAGLPRVLGWDKRQVLLGLSLFFSLGPVAQSIRFTMDRSFYEQPPRALQSMEKGGRLYNAPSVEEHFRNVSGHGVADAYRQLKEAVVSNWPLAWGLEEAGYSNALFVRSYLDWYYAPVQWGGSPKILDYLNVRNVIGWMPSMKRPVQVTAGEAPLCLNPTLRPKWTSCENAVPGTDWGTELTTIYGKSFDFSKTCFTDETALQGPFQHRKVEAKDLGPNGKELTAVGPGRCLLVSSETAYPGWRATSGGKAVPLVSVNHGFRGVVLDAGEEKVLISFRPTSFRLGLFLSLLVCLFWLGTLFTRWRPRHA